MSDRVSLYSITNNISGKMYIGMSADPVKRLVAHSRTHGKAPTKSCIRDAILKYGKENFTLKVLVIGSREYCFGLEKRAIASYGTLIPNGYNIHKGADTGPYSKRGLEHHAYGKPRSDETKAKLRTAFLGRPISEEQKAQISKTLTGRPLSPERKLQAQQNRVGHTNTPEHNAAISKANTGLIRSAETRAKISATKQGHMASEEQCKKQSEFMKSKWDDPVYRKFMIDARRVAKLKRLENKNVN